MAKLEIESSNEIQWVPRITMDPGVYLPSTWKEGKGKPLTDKQIRKYQLAGKYGDQARLIQLKVIEQQKPTPSQALRRHLNAKERARLKAEYV